MPPPAEDLADDGDPVRSMCRVPKRKDDLRHLLQPPVKIAAVYWIILDLNIFKYLQYFVKHTLSPAQHRPLLQKASSASPIRPSQAQPPVRVPRIE